MNELEMATAERTDLADFLATLTLDQWEAPSLCERWRVRDVVAHVMSFDGVTLVGMLRRAVRGRLIHINQVGVDELASLSTEQLLDRLRGHLRPQGLATTFGGRLALLDVTIHHQDIRRPLGVPRQIPAERLRCVLARQRPQPRAAGVAPLPRRTPGTDRPGLESRLGTRDHRTGGSRADGGRRAAECRRGADRSRAADTGQPARTLTAPVHHPCGVRPASSTGCVPPARGRDCVLSV